MGGAQAGELASSLAAAALRDEASELAGGEERVNDLIQEANRRVYQRQAQDASASGMGTTMTVALVEDGRVAIGHVGDSRAYLIRDRKLEQLTEDHSLVAELVRSGKLSPEEAEGHPQRSVITRALGTDPDVDVDTFSVETKPGDLFLLCSDGLTSMVDDETILREVERNRGDLARAAKALVRAANKGGGEDNITVVFFEITGGDEGEHTVTLPPVEEDEDEKTLDEFDGVPPVAVQPRDENGHAGRRALFALLVLVLIVAVCGFAVWGLWRSHFVGAEQDGHVVVYQGLPWNIVGSVKLYRPVYVSPLLASQLSQAERQKLFDHTLRSDDSARAAGAALRGADRSRMSVLASGSLPWGKRVPHVPPSRVAVEPAGSPASTPPPPLIRQRSPDEPPQPRAGEPRRRRRAHRSRVRQRLHRAAGGRLDRLALVRPLLLRALPRGPSRRAPDRPVRRSVPAADGRPADRGRPDRDLPAQPLGRVPPGHLDRGRARRLLGARSSCCTATTGGSRATSTCSGSRRSCC